MFPVRRYPFEVENSWYSAKADIVSFEPEELFGTKLRALLQRRKNRDLFDIHEGMKELSLYPDRLIACLEHYLNIEGVSIGRAAAEQRLLERLQRSLTEDVVPLLPVGVTFSEEDAVVAIERILQELVPRLRGESWRRSGEFIEAIRADRHPNFLRKR